MRNGRKKIMTVLLSFILCLAAAAASPAASFRMDKSTMKKSAFGKLENPGANTKPKLCARTTYGKSVDLKKYKLDGSLKYVHPMWYIMTTKSAVNAKSADNTKTSVKVKKGTTVVVLRLKDSAVCRLKGGRTVIIPKKKLNWKWHIYNSGKAYRDVQIEEWVNSHDITSKTKYLFCVSRYNQHGWIMEGKKGAWKCKYVFKLSTIAYGPQEYGWNHCEISQHYIGKKNVGGGISISYASKAGGNQIHIGKGGHPATHGCIGMSKKSLNFVYYYLPIGTRVLTI